MESKHVRIGRMIQKYSKHWPVAFQRLQAKGSSVTCVDLPGSRPLLGRVLVLALDGF